jgi:hypothetical protein
LTAGPDQDSSRKTIVKRIPDAHERAVGLAAFHTFGLAMEGNDGCFLTMPSNERCATT